MELQRNIIEEVFDLLAGFDVDKPQNQRETIQTVINHLGSYPKATPKHSKIEPHPNILGAYLCISNVRNACKLALLGVYSIDTLTLKVDEELITALNLLLSLKD